MRSWPDWMYGLYHDYSFEQSVLFGNITGGTCVTAVGCLSARLTESELLENSSNINICSGDAPGAGF